MHIKLKIHDKMFKTLLHNSKCLGIFYPSVIVMPIASTRHCTTILQQGVVVPPGVREVSLRPLPIRAGRGQFQAPVSPTYSPSTCALAAARVTPPVHPQILPRLMRLSIWPAMISLTPWAAAVIRRMRVPQLARRYSSQVLRP